MKKIILSFAILAFTVGAKAQKHNVGATTANVAVNIGAATESGYKLVYGADLQVEHSLSPTLNVTGSAGFENFHWSEAGLSGNAGFIPVLVGAKAFFGESKAYAHAQLGAGFSTQKNGGTSFAYAPSIGYYLSDNLDASVKYLAFSKNSHTLGTIGVRVAYNF